jgi:hypothetical protein
VVHNGQQYSFGEGYEGGLDGDEIDLAVKSIAAHPLKVLFQKIKMILKSAQQSF